MEWKHCLLSKGGQLQCRRKKMFFCIIIQRKVINLRNTTNNICVSVSSDITDWDNINWYSVEKYVDKQQKRIYEAEVNKDKRKVRNIQRMLTNSRAVLLLAVRRVTEINKGRNTPGPDGFLAKTSKEKGELVDRLSKKNIYNYIPSPTRRIYIPKKNGKKRPLSIPSITDRIYQEIIRIILEPQMEARFEPTSYGFRPKRGVYDAIERIFLNIKGNKWCWVLEGDFKGCFDNLSHDFILKQLKGFTLKGVVERILKAGYLDNNVFNETIKGTPQGGLLSPLSANIALTGLEEYLNITYKEIKHDKNDDEYVTYATKGDYRVVRYADDFVIFAKTKEEINEVRNILEPYLDERGLELAEDKTKSTHPHKGFNFLGFNCRLYKSQNRYKCLIKPSKESIKKAKRKINDIFYYCRGNSVDFLIDKLNPVIEGIGYFWRISVAKQAYSEMDNYIWKKLYHFLRRLHPHKSWKWIVNKYFPQYDEEGNFIGKWTLVGPNDKNQITKMASIPIRRWNMIKYNYSPYDVSKTEYFENRMRKQFSRR